MTHLYDHAQVSDIHALRLDDLHDDPVQVGQLGIGRHTPADERGRMPEAAGAPSGRGFFVPVVSVYKAPPPPLRALSSVLGRAQVQVNV